MERSKEELLTSLLAQVKEAQATAEDTAKALVRKVESLPPATAAMTELVKRLPEDAPDVLREIFLYALMGVSLGFGERNLSPYLEVHLEIIEPLLEDIRAVYDQVNKTGAEVKKEEFHRQAFDFGLHKAYYLDWRLYMSKEMY